MHFLLQNYFPYFGINTPVFMGPRELDGGETVYGWFYIF